jgi:hypothetical protein
MHDRLADSKADVVGARVELGEKPAADGRIRRGTFGQRVDPANRKKLAGRGPGSLVGRKSHQGERHGVCPLAEPPTLVCEGVREAGVHPRPGEVRAAREEREERLRSTANGLVEPARERIRRIGRGHGAVDGR